MTQTQNPFLPQHPSIFDRTPHLRAIGLSTSPVLIELDGLVVQEDTIGEHRLIVFETGVLPSALKMDDNGLTVEVYRSELERENFTAKAFTDAIEELVVPKVTVVVVENM